MAAVLLVSPRKLVASLNVFDLGLDLEMEHSSQFATAFVTLWKVMMMPWDELEAVTKSNSFSLFLVAVEMKSWPFQ